MNRSSVLNLKGTKLIIFAAFVIILLVIPMASATTFSNNDLTVELLTVDTTVVVHENGFAYVSYRIHLQVTSGTLHYITMEATEGIQKYSIEATVNNQSITDSLSSEKDGDTLKIYLGDGVDAPADVLLEVNYYSTKRIVGVTDDGKTAYVVWYPITFPDSGANYTALLVFHSIKLNSSDYDPNTGGVYQNATDKIGFTVGKLTLDNWDKYVPVAVIVDNVAYFGVRVYKNNVLANDNIPVEFAFDSHYFDVPAGTEPYEESFLDKVTGFINWYVNLFSTDPDTAISITIVAGLGILFLAVLIYPSLKSFSQNMSEFFEKRKIINSLRKLGINVSKNDPIDFLKEMYRITQTPEFKELLASKSIDPSELKVDYDQDGVYEPSDVVQFFTDKLREYYINKIVPEISIATGTSPQELRNLMRYANPYNLKKLLDNIDKAKKLIREGFASVEEILTHPGQIESLWEEYLNVLSFKENVLPPMYRNYDMRSIRNAYESYNDQRIIELISNGLVTWDDLLQKSHKELVMQWTEWKKRILSQELYKAGVTEIPEGASIKDLQQALEKLKMPEVWKLNKLGILSPNQVFFYTPEQIKYMAKYAETSGVRDAPTIIFEQAISSEQLPQLDPVEYAIFRQEDASTIISLLITSAVQKKYIEVIDSNEQGMIVRTLRHTCPICNAPMPKLEYDMCLTCGTVGHKEHLIDENGYCRICGDKAKIIHVTPKYYEKMLVSLAEDGFLSVADLQSVLDIIARRVQNLVWRADWSKIRKEHERYIRRSWYHVYDSPYPYYYYYRGYTYRDGELEWTWLWLNLDKEKQKFFEGLKQLIPRDGKLIPDKLPDWLPEEIREAPKWAHREITKAMEQYLIPPQFKDLAKALKLDAQKILFQLENIPLVISRQLSNNFTSFARKVTEIVNSCVSHDDCHSACHSACVWSACHSACHSAGGWG